MKEPKWFRFSDRDPNALRSRLRDINKIVLKYIENDPDGKGGYLIDMREIERLSRVE